MIVLNVGGGPTRYLPPRYDGWEQHLLDIDPAVAPDIVCDAADMADLAPAQYDAVFCSHNLEHFYAHDVPKVLSGFLHVLKPGAVVEIGVPNLNALMRAMLAGNLDITDTWYRAGPNAISFHDVLFGWSAQMAQGNLYYAHKCGFTEHSLGAALAAAGFVRVQVADQGANLLAIGYKQEA
jgi:predicted SAM-dependent methyltransferase